MFRETMGAAIDGARTLAQMDELSRQIWQAHTSGAVDDTGAQSLAERLHERRGSIRAGIVPVGVPAGRVSLFPPRRRPVSPDRIASRDRRRLLACSGPMPPTLARRFPPGELAVLRIVADEVAEKGICGLCIDAIAARAGVCRRLAQAANRPAGGEWLVSRRERRHQGRRSDPNLIRIISREWQAWMKGARRIGCKTLHPTDNRVLIRETPTPVTPSRKLPERPGRLGDTRSPESARMAGRSKAVR